jgi:predicted transcriptional regulator
MIKIDVKYRRLMLQHPQIVRDAFLGRREAEIAHFVFGRLRPTISSDVAHEFGITVANASTVLAGLVTSGYLKRLQVPDPTGGIMYEYSPAFSLTEEAYSNGG